MFVSFISCFVILRLINTCLALPNPKLRIIGGEDANIEDYPFQISLQYQNSHFCGGSILNEYYIITAAHCTDGFSVQDLSIRAGSTYHDKGGQVSQVKKIFQHPNFVDETFDYDIAILQLDTPLQFSSTVRSISLATSGTNIESGLDGYVSGWGITKQNSRILPSHLKQVMLPTISFEDCLLYYGANLTERMFCAGYPEIGGKDTCEGDSGGPYVVGGILLGLTSWGYECATPKIPGVFSSLPYLRQYVDEILNS